MHSLTRHTLAPAYTHTFTLTATSTPTHPVSNLKAILCLETRRRQTGSRYLSLALLTMSHDPVESLTSADATDFAATFSRLTPDEEAEAAAQAAILDELLPLTPDPSKPSTSATRAAAWANGFRMEACPRVELHYWTNVSLACMLAARAGATDKNSLLPPDVAVMMARPARLEDSAKWWREAEEMRRRQIYSFVVAYTSGIAMPGPRAGVEPGLAQVYAGCCDTVKLCRAGETKALEEYKLVRRAGIKKCAGCQTLSADLLQCAACGSASFCNKKCQVKAWASGHKKKCKEAQARNAEEKAVAAKSPKTR